MGKLAVAILLALALVGCENTDPQKYEDRELVTQGVVVSRTCKLKACYRWTITVNYPDGSVKKYQIRDKISRKCVKNAQYPKCIGIKYITDY